MIKHSVRCDPYIRNHTSYGCHLRCTCVKWFLFSWYSSCCFFFNFSKSFDFPGFQRVKRQEMDQNGKKILSVAPSISVTIYHDLHTYVKGKYLQAFFFIFKKFWFLGSWRGWQGSRITMKSPYLITYVCQNFGVRDARGQIQKSIYQVSYLFPSGFPNNFS